VSGATSGSSTTTSAARNSSCEPLAQAEDALAQAARGRLGRHLGPQPGGDAVARARAVDREQREQGRVLALERPRVGLVAAGDGHAGKADERWHRGSASLANG
jgi:hypothetical protein